MKERKFIITVTTGFAGCTHEDEVILTEKDCDLSDDEEVESLVFEYGQEFLQQRIELSWEEEKDV